MRIPAPLWLLLLPLACSEGASGDAPAPVGEVGGLGPAGTGGRILDSERAGGTAGEVAAIGGRGGSGSPSGGGRPGAGGLDGEGRAGSGGAGIPTGGGTFSGGAGGRPGAGATGGAADGGEAGGATIDASPRFPEPGSTGQCPDPSIRLRFTGTPALGTSGSVRIYDAANPELPVAQVDLAVPQVTDTIFGSRFDLPRPAFVDGHEAIFVFPAAGLAWGHTYAVTVDPGVITGPDGESVAITNLQDWRFTVRDEELPSPSELRVALDGTGQFCSVQGAIAAAGEQTTVSIEPGAYFGVVYFTGKNGLRLRGVDRETTRLLGVNNNNLNPSTRGRALVGAENLRDLTVENLTIENLTPQGGSQAEALTLLSCDRCIVRNSTIRSRQDTLLWSGRVYAEDSLVEGNVDFIWGTGTAYFNRVEVRTVGRPGYAVQARNSNADYGYVFVDSKLTAEPGISGDVLARIDVDAYPFSHVAYVDCEMGPHISAEGWVITGSSETSGLRFWEYQSRGADGSPIDTSRRASGSRQLTAVEADRMRDAAVVLGGWDPR